VGLSYDDFSALFPKVRHEALHLEMRDSYGTAVEIPHLAKWAAGEPDDLGWLQPWCTFVRNATAIGKVFRRARVVSEPLITGRPTMTDPSLIARCRASFEAVWALSIPHREYTPDAS
jgi:hypothetical protein